MESWKFSAALTPRRGVQGAVSGRAGTGTLGELIPVALLLGTAVS